MTLESSKTLGGVGAILVVVGFLGFFGTGYAGLLSLVGIILTMIALKGVSDYYNEGGIFNNALYGFITGIIGGVVFVATIAAMTLMVILPSEFDWTNPDVFRQYFMDMNALWNIIGTIIIAFVVLFIFVIFAAIFFRRSLSKLAMKSGERIFETAGLLWLIGAILTIIAIGFILIWIAWILIAVGFFSIKTTAQPVAAAPQPPPPPP